MRCRYNAAVDWGRDVGGGGVAAFLERVILPLLKARCLRVQVVVCSDNGHAAVAAVVACLQGGELQEWSKGDGNIVNAAQLCTVSVSVSGPNLTCPCCSSIPPHHLDFALLSRCHWALVSNSTFGTAARMSVYPLFSFSPLTSSPPAISDTHRFSLGAAAARSPSPGA
jgi:hypothetical protein